MSKNKNNESGYIYFQDTEETVIRKDETQKNAVAKFVKRKKKLPCSGKKPTLTFPHLYP